MNERRIKRLQEQLKARIAEILMREIRDPKVGIVTITRVELDREFTSCKAYWSVLGDGRQRAHTERALRRASGFVQREMGSTLHTRTVPHLVFIYDDEMAEAFRIQEQLAELRREREEREAAQATEEKSGDPSEPTPQDPPPSDHPVEGP
jgi:ribosome-binding factor A